MNFFADAITWILDPAHFAVENGIWPRTVDHLFYTAVTMAIALAIAIPLGLFIGHTGRGRGLVIVTTSAFRALPTLGFLLFIILFTGLGLWPFVAVMVVLAVPPLLAGVYSGLENVDRQTIDAARAVGMSEWQIIGRVELPLALPLILGGVRSATLQVIATATIAGYVGLTGLGRFLIEGLARHDFVRAIVGAVLVAALALVADGALALIQRLVVPRGVSRGMARTTTGPRRFSGTPALNAAPTTEG
jgi:osmoprotectant transport system permease protein